nr:hypothetical protein [Kocuria atrinae]
MADGKLGAHKILTPHAGELEQVFEWLKGFGITDDAPDRARIEAAPVHWAREAARLTGARCFSRALPRSSRRRVPRKTVWNRCA